GSLHVPTPTHSHYILTSQKLLYYGNQLHTCWERLFLFLLFFSWFHTHPHTHTHTEHTHTAHTHTHTHTHTHAGQWDGQQRPAALLVLARWITGVVDGGVFPSWKWPEKDLGKAV